jgi:hypothetical protein
MSAVGHKADIPLSRYDVRFTPGSGHWLSGSGCLLCAKSGRRPIVDVRCFGSDFKFEADLHDLPARDFEMCAWSLGVVIP